MSNENYTSQTKHMLNKAEDYFNENFGVMNADTKVLIYLFSALVYALLKIAEVLAYGNRR